MAEPVAITRSTLASSFCAFADALNAYGLDADTVFEKAGVDPRRRFQAGARYSLAQAAAIWRQSLRITKDPALGLNVARQANPQYLHALGLAWMASADLLDALQRLVRYHHVVTTIVTMSLKESPTEGCLVFALPQTPEMDDLHEVRDCVALSILRMCRQLAGRRLTPTAVHLRRPPPSDPEPWANSFRCPLHFGADENRLDFDQQDLLKPLPGHNRELALANDVAASSYLKQMRRGEISDRVRRKLIELLPSSHASQTIVADELHMSRRTLQRRLDEEGVTFSELMDDVRSTLATEYLRQAHHSVTDVAFLLGYSDPRNFARAFRRWIGQSPQEFRATRGKAAKETLA